jgi:RNA polymerase sigma-70 factor, ECF subfamily
MTEQPDLISSLLTAVAAEDRAAFRALYTSVSAKLMGVLFRILGNRAEAEDALQEVMTRVWLKARGFDPARGSAMSWLITMARNHAIDRIRARPPISDDEAAMDLAPDTTPRAETRLIAAGEARRIGDCFDTLEADKAAAIRGAYLDGLSYLDLAARHDVPLNTMRTWLRRGLAKLKECMEQ